MAVPELTREERLAALEQAKAARIRRAQVKDDLHDGKISLIEVLAMKDDEAIGKMKVFDLIQCIPHYGEAKAKKVMDELKISPSRRIRGLGKRQEIDLVQRLG